MTDTLVDAIPCRRPHCRDSRCMAALREESRLAHEAALARIASATSDTLLDVLFEIFTDGYCEDDDNAVNREVHDAIEGRYQILRAARP